MPGLPMQPCVPGGASRHISHVFPSHGSGLGEGVEMGGGWHGPGAAMRPTLVAVLVTDLSPADLGILLEPSLGRIQTFDAVCLA